MDYNLEGKNEQRCSLTSDNLCSSAPSFDSMKRTVDSTPRVINTISPAIPPRNYLHQARTPLMGNIYNNSMSSRYPFASSRYPYSGYSTYGSYGYNSYPYQSYNGMFGAQGMGAYNVNNPESRFIRAAEESARPTFQAIETVTQAINSIAFMMESTFGTLSMSFQAILSVIETFSQARKFLKQFLTSILTLRIFHKFLLMLINLMRRMNIVSEQAVENLSFLSGSSQATPMAGFSIWPILSFFGLIFGAPYIISRMLPQELGTKSENEWDPNTDTFVPLVATHDFKAGTPQELTFYRGQRLKMAPPEVITSAAVSPYWVFVADDQNNKGFVPKNHVAPL